MRRHREETDVENGNSISSTTTTAAATAGRTTETRLIGANASPRVMPSPNLDNVTPAQRKLMFPSEDRGGPSSSSSSSSSRKQPHPPAVVDLNPNGWREMRRAVWHGDVEAVDALVVQQGISIEIAQQQEQEHDGVASGRRQSLILDAVQMNQPKIVKILVRSDGGALAAAQLHPVSGETVFHHCVKGKQFELLRWLCSSEGAPGAKTAAGTHEIILIDQPPTPDAKAPVRHIRRSTPTPLELATSLGLAEAISILSNSSASNLSHSCAKPQQQRADDVIVIDDSSDDAAS